MIDKNKEIRIVERKEDSIPEEIAYQCGKFLYKLLKAFRLGKKRQ